MSHGHVSCHQITRRKHRFIQHWSISLYRHRMTKFIVFRDIFELQFEPFGWWDKAAVSPQGHVFLRARDSLIQIKVNHAPA
jgi:hypothetical protein